MTRFPLFVLAAWFAITALWLLISPAGFYTTIPGVAESGPLNVHFARDVGLAIAVSAVALAYGAHLRDWRIALVGAGFPALHGALHVIEALHHGGHGGAEALVGTVLPGLLALMSVWMMPRVRQVAP